MTLDHLHSKRQHAKFSASGAERWTNCSGAIPLSEGIPDKPNKYALEGTFAHENLERYSKQLFLAELQYYPPITPEMWSYVQNAGDFIFELYEKNPDSEVLIEARVDLSWIHEEAFGTLDNAVLDFFGTLHVLDFKYGVSPVSAIRNLQLIFYALGIAYKYHWNFKRVRMWIQQPRVRGYDGPTFWEISIFELKKYVDVFSRAVERVERYPHKYTEGPWCHWCKAKVKCPLKQKKKLDEASLIFGELE